MDFDSGKIYIQDEENNESMDYEKIGYVYSTPILPEFLTGYEFIKFFTDINKKKIKNIKTPEEYADMVCLCLLYTSSLTGEKAPMAEYIRTSSCLRHLAD